MDRLILHLESGEAAALELTHEQLFDAPAADQVPDIGALIPGRRGRGVRFAWVASLASPGDELVFVTLESTDGRFSATLTREEMAEAVIVHADEIGPSEPMTAARSVCTSPARRTAAATSSTSAASVSAHVLERTPARQRRSAPAEAEPPGRPGGLSPGTI